MGQRNITNNWNVYDLYITYINDEERVHFKYISLEHFSKMFELAREASPRVVSVKYDEVLLNRLRSYLYWQEYNYPSFSPS